MLHILKVLWPYYGDFYVFLSCDVMCTFMHGAPVDSNMSTNFGYYVDRMSSLYLHYRFIIIPVSEA